MTKEVTIQQRPAPLTVADYAHNAKFKAKIEETLGKRTPQFISSVISLANSDKTLSLCDPVKLFNCCMMAAALNLPFNQNLGQAFIIAYKGEPQLQIGWKGFVQLAQRSGQFRTINCSDVREGEILEQDRLTGEFKFGWKTDAERLQLPMVGYVAYFELLNGFRKTFYMSKNELEQHAKRYSQTYRKGYGVWKDNFDAMAQKTVIKLLLNKFAPLSVEMERAIEIDQSDSDGDYVDAPGKVEIIDAEMGESEEDAKNE